MFFDEGVCEGAHIVVDCCWYVILENVGFTHEVWEHVAIGEIGPYWWFGAVDGEGCFKKFCDCCVGCVYADH